MLLTAPANAQYEAVASWGSLSTFARPPMPLPSYPAGFFLTRFATWPSSIPPVIQGYPNPVTGGEYRTMTLYSNDERAFTIGLLWGFNIDNPFCGCAGTPAYYVYLQMTPPNQGMNPWNQVHDSLSWNYYCCVYGDGNAHTLLAQWDMSNGWSSVSFDGRPWVGPFMGGSAGLPFNVGISSTSQSTHLDSDLVSYWPNYPQQSTNFIGAISDMALILWDHSGSAPVNAVDLVGNTGRFGNNYGAGGQFTQYGPFDDYIIWGP